MGDDPRHPGLTRRSSRSLWTPWFDLGWAADGPLPSGPGAVTIAVDEDRRSRSYERLAEAIGRDEAVTIFELLPPPDADLATRADLEVVESRLEALSATVDLGFGDVHRQLDRIDDGLRDLRGEVVTAIAGQTRALVLGVLTATVSIGGLSVVLAQL